MLTPSFQIQLQEKLFPGLVCYGKFDGSNPSVAAATSGNRILIHSPHSDHPEAEQTTFLRVKRKVLALTTGCLDSTHGRDMLFIGTGQDVQAYDVQENADLFFKDVPDGVGCLLVGVAGNSPQPLLFVGSSLSITGLDVRGKEKFWTVSNDNVSALALADVDRDGEPELLAGADSFDIHVFKQETLIAEFKEADQIVALCSIEPGTFAYALSNCTIGVYKNSERAWRVKSKNQANCICAYDFNGDGNIEVISGWSNGKFEVRSASNGEVLYRDQLSKAVVDVSIADLRNDGTHQVLACLESGEIRGYLAANLSSMSKTVQDKHQRGVLSQTLQDLELKKRELAQELHLLQQNLNDGLMTETASTIGDIIPADTDVLGDLRVNEDACRLELVLSTNNSTVIRGVVMFAEQMFDGESLFVHYSDPRSEAVVPIAPRKDTAVDMLIKVFVGTATSSIFHVFDLKTTVARFSLFHQMSPEDLPRPAGFVTFHVKNRPARFLSWLKEAMHFEGEAQSDGSVGAGFLCLRDGTSVLLTFEAEDNGTRGTIMADSVEVAGTLLLALTADTGITELASVIDFPDDIAHARDVFETIAEAKTHVKQMHTDAADSSALIKSLLVKAEDARLLSNVKTMRKHYRALRDLNADLVNDHDRRVTRHNELSDNLKELNRIVQAAAKMRLGKPKDEVVTLCRQAIKDEDSEVFLRVLREGTI